MSAIAKASQAVRNVSIEADLSEAAAKERYAVDGEDNITSAVFPEREKANREIAGHKANDLFARALKTEMDG